MVLQSGKQWVCDELGSQFTLLKSYRENLVRAMVEGRATGNLDEARKLADDIEPLLQECKRMFFPYLPKTPDFFWRKELFGGALLAAPSGIAHVRAGTKRNSPGYVYSNQIRSSPRTFLPEQVPRYLYMHQDQIPAEWMQLPLPGDKVAILFWGDRNRVPEEGPVPALVLSGNYPAVTVADAHIDPNDSSHRIFSAVMPE